MSARTPLPNRRGAVAFNFAHRGMSFRAHVGFFPDGSPAELFLNAEKQNSALDGFGSDAAILLSLCLQRGAPLADAAPGQWHWAEELRTDMISCVRDIGVELADRALLAGDVERARWAAARALLVAPGDELLLAARIRTEHQAGNAAETERLTLQLAAHARTLGVDLDPETVALLQRVMEGQVRARLA